jgi:hypothetical protein
MATYVFYRINWIRPYEGGTLWEAALWLFFGLWFVKLLLWLPKFLTKMLTLPVSIISAGSMWYLIDGVFTYFSLLIIAYWSKVFTIPYPILQNAEKIIVMALVFSLISYICRPKITYTSTSSSTSHS